MNEPEEDFAALFAASTQAKQFEKGQTVEGTVVGIRPEVAFVDVGGKGEAVLDTAELKNADGVVEVKVGDRIQAVVTSTSGGLTLSRRLARGAATDHQIADAFHAHLPVEGKVERLVKGGYEVRVGRQRAFCPLSQIDVARTADPGVHVGCVYPFRILEYKDDGRNLVVSRRALLEADQRARADEVRRSVVPGAVLHGRVVSVRDYGAFVDLGGGVQGLLHVSDMGWSRVADVTQAVTPGEEITVQVLRVDPETQKIALGVKQLTEDPWANVLVSYQAGQVRPGRVTRIAEFGAFVELEPGVEGLAHASTFPPSAGRDGWSRSVAVGMTGEFEILSIDPAKRRIGVALVQETSRAERADGPSAASRDAIVPGARLTGTIERIEKFGVLVFLAPGRTGLVPLGETGVAREGDLAKAFPVGGTVEVMVLEVDPSGRRIRLSRKAILDAQEAEELREYRERAQPSESATLGSLGDKLRGALEPRRK